MGYVVAMSPCLRCKRIFAYNPHKVPSMRLRQGGEKQPICADCCETINAIRTAMGLDPWPEPEPGAYEAIDENEL